MHLTDYRTGRILSMTAEGEEVRTEFEGKVGERAMRPDHIAFGPDGAMYITDSSPTTYPEGGHDGRVVRIDPETGAADVLASDLPNPNGISLSGDGRELWVGMLDGSRIDRLLLDDSGAEVETGHAAVHVSGGDAQPDSNAIDADGNIYQAMHGRPEIRVYSPDGQHRRTIEVPAGDGEFDSATNLAIRPGTTEAYATVSGASGGSLYRFEASGEGVRASNGG